MQTATDDDIDSSNDNLEKGNENFIQNLMKVTTFKVDVIRITVPVHQHWSIVDKIVER